MSVHSELTTDEATHLVADAGAILAHRAWTSHLQRHQVDHPASPLTGDDLATGWEQLGEPDRDLYRTVATDILTLLFGDCRCYCWLRTAASLTHAVAPLPPVSPPRP